jgi:hypothetical protein
MQYHITNSTITIKTIPSTHDITVIDFGTGLERKKSLRMRVWVRFRNPRARHTRRAMMMNLMEGV